MHKQIIRRSPDIEDLQKFAGLHPVLSRIYAARAVRSRQELECGLEQLHDFRALKGIDKAADLIEQALRGQRKILVVADFDADGATSCAVTLRALRAFGATSVEYIVPNRFTYGYGLTPEIVEVAKTRNPDLLITVDNGISSIEGVARARAAGILVLVTDHHLPADRLPNADAIVNPNQPGDEFPSKSLAGVGVIFYVMLAVRNRLRSSGWFAENNIQEPNLANLLDLVALGTVADVVTLDANNRALVEQGMKRIRAGRGCPGIRALLEMGGRLPDRLVAADLGFVVGPRLNAAGRLEDMSLGIECLLTDDPDRAREYAVRLDALNLDRREIEEQMKQQAFRELERLQLGTDENAMALGLCLYDPQWHQGVIGILASRIKDRLHRPVIAFARTEDGEIKGSARSIKGVHIRDVLDAIAARHPGLIEKFGGHAMAAGLSIREENLAAFTEAFDEEVRNWISEDDLTGTIHTDGELADNEISLELAEQLRMGGPWGQGFPEPVFDGEFEIVQKRIVAEKHLKLLLRVPNGRQLVDAIAFNAVENHWTEEARKLRMAYRLDVNEYRGQRNVQLQVEYMEAAT